MTNDRTNRYSSLLQIKRRISVILLLCGFLLNLDAQNRPIPKLDGLNEYQIMIEVMEDQGIDIQNMLRDVTTINKLAKDNINVDSIAKYYNLKYEVDVSKDIVKDKGTIAILAKSYTDSIVLRWGPTSSVAWEKLIKTGYILERWTMTSATADERQWIDTTSLLVLADTTDPILPWTLEKIGVVVKPTDTMAVIATQAMYGSSFTSDINTDSLDFYSRFQEKEMRFGISLLMADRSALAADLMGLRYVDKNVEANKTYTYIIRPIGLNELDNYSTMINDPKENEKVVGLKIKEADGKIILYWPKHPNGFSGYWVERSSDRGESWKKLTAEPIVFIEQEYSEIIPADIQDDSDQQYNEEISAVLNYIIEDSLANNIKYKYRVSGQTAFADYTDYAYAEGKAVDLTAPPVPQVIFNEVNEQTGIATIKWEMNYSAVALEDLAGFTIWKAAHPDSTFIQISELLPKTTRQYSSQKPLKKDRSHYYLLKAQDDKGNISSSFLIYMHLIDDIPPTPPLDPIYEINDSTGVVTLRWKPNTEMDIQGYRVYFSNRLDREFSQLTKTPIHQNIYYDTIALVTLSEKIYYKMQAVDLSHNRSDFSEIVEVQRPDYVAPVAPIMEDPDISDQQVVLHWRPSGSEDVTKQILYRRVFQSDEEWTVLIEFGDPTINTFIDTTGREEVLYEYSLRVVDDVNLYSDYAFPVKARRWFNNVIPIIEDFNAVYNKQAMAVELSWTFEPVNHPLLNGVDYMFYIYRSAVSEPRTTYRRLKSNENSYLDTKVIDKMKYQYDIKVVYLNGKSGETSDQKIVLVDN